MTAQIAIEAADFAALHTHAANRGEVLQVRFLHLCREVTGTTTTTPAATPEAAPAAPAPVDAPAERKPRPRIVYPSLTGPGDILPDPGNIDWDDPATYL